MSDGYDVGDWRIPTLAVAEGDGFTVALVEVVNPSTGAVVPLAAATSDGGKTWEAAPYELTVSGEWVERWTVTGSGAGKQRFVLAVAPDPAAVLPGVRVYATTTDYADQLRVAPPAGTRGRLVDASRLVEEATMHALYDVDGDGMPTDAAVLAAFKAATVAAADNLRKNGDQGDAANWATLSIGSLSMTRAAGATGPQPAAVRIGDNARRILQLAGLLGQPGSGQPRDALGW
ncbi:hypothetical protein GCM10018962_77130 [Dactylosporangium matsuzakiense]|uniref:hypothetical protein n=1 Tax=Dactylosporangium matsuzakiense TaxID=53360 RepID=UPI0031EEC3A7